ncbi:septum formation initiator family protein [Candidatus Parcubacteria bacterium]|jgi:cell division protein FtsB|nr:septum formation initiator family protein [Candidatus Parcubacteria bacterium]
MKRKKTEKDWRGKIWGSNVFTLILVLLLILSFVKVSKEVVLRYNIHQEIKELEGQLSELKEKTETTDKLITYLKTDEYVEKQARSQLNLSKPGEKQINLFTTDSDRNIIEQGGNLPNINKWFNYFFK